MEPAFAERVPIYVHTYFISSLVPGAENEATLLGALLLSKARWGI